jgi:F-type H+-transporting ATPase subunit epsilon
VIYEGEAKRVFLTGDIAEFEIMDFHVPIISLLRPGQVLVDGRLAIDIKNGMVKFNNNECTILVEE